MPSVTVVVSSDTDIYISPGLYGDCLPTFQPAGPRIHSGSAPGFSGSFPTALSLMLAHASGGGQPLRRRDSRHIDMMGIVKVT
ncbi:hypothetical protein GTY84_06460 [Streptomyces sp. SID8352]|nr:hypothetical protein [Streptomyces sp. SID8352]